MRKNVKTISGIAVASIVLSIFWIICILDAKVAADFYPYWWEGDYIFEAYPYMNVDSSYADIVNEVDMSIEGTLGPLQGYSFNSFSCSSDSVAVVDWEYDAQMLFLFKNGKYCGVRYDFSSSDLEAFHDAYQQYLVDMYGFDDYSRSWSTSDGTVVAYTWPLIGANYDWDTKVTTNVNYRLLIFRNDYDGQQHISVQWDLFPVWEIGPDDSSSVNMYRLYNPNSGEHFYTSSVGERDNLINVGWTYEGIGWQAPFSSNTPVYRLYNTNGGEHHYTTSLAERNNLISLGWNDEGIGWYSDDAQTVPLYRQYNPNAFANNHNYTISLSENDWLVSIGWQPEGIGWYGVG